MKLLTAAASLLSPHFITQCYCASFLAPVRSNDDIILSTLKHLKGEFFNMIENGQTSRMQDADPQTILNAKREGDEVTLSYKLSGEIFLTTTSKQTVAQLTILVAKTLNMISKDSTCSRHDDLRAESSNYEFGNGMGYTIDAVDKNDHDFGWCAYDKVISLDEFTLIKRYAGPGSSLRSRPGDIFLSPPDLEKWVRKENFQSLVLFHSEEKNRRVSDVEGVVQSLLEEGDTDWKNIFDEDKRWSQMTILAPESDDAELTTNLEDLIISIFRVFYIDYCCNLFNPRFHNPRNRTQDILRKLTSSLDLESESEEWLKNPCLTINSTYILDKSWRRHFDSDIMGVYIVEKYIFPYYFQNSIAPYTCKGKHGLNHETSDEELNCDECSANIVPGMKTWRCSVCDHNVCESCWSEKNNSEVVVPLTRCPGNHALVPATDEWLCDICDENDSSHCCKLCDFDVCGKCHQQTETQVKNLSRGSAKVTRVSRTPVNPRDHRKTSIRNAVYWEINTRTASGCFKKTFLALYQPAVMGSEVEYRLKLRERYEDIMSDFDYHHRV